ncbi:PHP domain-containing protein [Bacillota bacterium]
MVDMHLHTYYSDGTLSPEELVKRAADRGILTMAITDHDGLNGIKEALEAGEKYGVKVIPGLEFSANMPFRELEPERFSKEGTGDDGGTIINMHILGYDIDVENEALILAVEQMRRKREERNRKLLKALQSIGLQIEEEDLIIRQGQDYIGKPNFALALKKKGYIETTKEANTPGRFLRHPAARKIHREKIHVREALSLIKNAGGYAVLAHPMKVKFEGLPESDKFNMLEKLLDKLTGWGLSGMECYYSSHTPEQTASLLKMAEKRGMIVTEGSDFHGPDFDPDLDIGVTGNTK